MAKNMRPARVQKAARQRPPKNTTLYTCDDKGLPCKRPGTTGKGNPGYGYTPAGK